MLNWPVSFVTYKSLNLDVDVTFYVSQHYYLVLHFNILLEGIAKISNFKIEMLIYSIQLSELILVIKSVPIWFTHRAWDIKLDSKTFCMDNKHRIVLTY